MRKHVLKVLIAMLAAVCSLAIVVACGPEETPPPAPETEYTVTYVGGTGAQGTAPASEKHAAGAKFNVAANTFTLEGKTFTAWNDGEKNVTAGSEYTMPAKNVTFTAQWQDNGSSGPSGPEGPTGPTAQTHAEKVGGYWTGHYEGTQTHEDYGVTVEMNVTADVTLVVLPYETEETRTEAEDGVDGTAVAEALYLNKSQMEVGGDTEVASWLMVGELVWVDGSNGDEGGYLFLSPNVDGLMLFYDNGKLEVPMGDDDESAELTRAATMPTAPQFSGKYYGRASYEDSSFTVLEFTEDGVTLDGTERTVKTYGDILYLTEKTAGGEPTAFHAVGAAYELVPGDDAFPMKKLTGDTVPELIEVDVYYFTALEYVKPDDEENPTYPDKTLYLEKTETFQTYLDAEPDAFEKPGYELTGWKLYNGSDNPDYATDTALTAKITLVAVYELLPPTVTFDSNGLALADGKSAPSLTVTKEMYDSGENGYKVTLPENPYTLGAGKELRWEYTFFMDGDPVESGVKKPGDELVIQPGYDLSLKAVEVDQGALTVTFKAGNWVDADVYVYVKSGETVPEEAFPTLSEHPDGYTQEGWWTEGEHTVFTHETQVTADTVVEARWLAYTVKFYADEESSDALGTLKFYAGENTTIAEHSGYAGITATPETNYTFAYWYYLIEGEAHKVGDYTMCEEIGGSEISLYARFALNQIAITTYEEAKYVHPDTIKPGDMYLLTGDLDFTLDASATAFNGIFFYLSNTADHVQTLTARYDNYFNSTCGEMKGSDWEPDQEKHTALNFTLTKFFVGYPSKSYNWFPSYEALQKGTINSFHAVLDYSNAHRIQITYIINATFTPTLNEGSASAPETSDFVVSYLIEKTGGGLLTDAYYFGLSGEQASLTNLSLSKHEHNFADNVCTECGAIDDRYPIDANVEGYEGMLEVVENYNNPDKDPVQWWTPGSACDDIAVGENFKAIFTWYNLRDYGFALDGAFEAFDAGNKYLDIDIMNAANNCWGQLVRQGDGAAATQSFLEGVNVTCSTEGSAPANYRGVFKCVVTKTGTTLTTVTSIGDYSVTYTITGLNATALTIRLHGNTGMLDNVHAAYTNLTPAAPAD